MPDLDAIRARLADIQDYLESVETYHVCGGSLHLEDVEPTHCEDCSWDCDDHGAPHCEPFYIKHDKAKRDVTALLAALDAREDKG